MNKLLVNKGTFEIQQIDLSGGILTVGRSKDCDIHLNDRSVSHKHAKFVTVMDTTYVEDLGSTNGVCVNGVCIKTHALHPDDIISIGSYDILFLQITPPKYARHTVDERTQFMEFSNIKQRSKKHMVAAKVGNTHTSANVMHTNQQTSQSDNKLQLVVNNLSAQDNNIQQQREAITKQGSSQARHTQTKQKSHKQKSVQYYNRNKEAPYQSAITNAKTQKINTNLTANNQKPKSKSNQQNSTTIQAEPIAEYIKQLNSEGSTSKSNFSNTFWIILLISILIILVFLFIMPDHNFSLEHLL